MNLLESKIDKLEIKIDKLESKVDDLIILLESNIAPSCNRMEHHIKFIEKIYDVVKYPIYLFMNKFNLLSNHKKNITL